MSVRRDVPAAVPPVVGLSTPVSNEGIGDSWTLELPFVVAPSLNDRMNRWAKAKVVKEWREAACWLARAAKIPRARKVRVILHYVPKDDRRRDPDNLVAAMKPMVDGLVDAGVVPDDTAEYVDRGWPEIHPKGPPRPRGNRFWIEITRLS